MNASQIINNPNLAEELADVLGYNDLDGSQSLLVKKDEFKLVPGDRVGYHVANQGWVECVSADTLRNLLGTGETSEDGAEEGRIVAAWMRNADNDPMGEQKY